MFPTQLPVISPDEFSRCDERQQVSALGKTPSPIQRSDASLKASVETAIWNDEVLRAIEFYEIDVHARDGIVYLNGHIANTTSRIRIENAIRSVPGILGLRNHLVLDEKLTLEIANALGKLEHTYSCKFFTGSSHGVISINGIVSSEDVKSLAEVCVSRNPHVRAVMNNVRVAGAIGPQLQDLPFLQPRMGATIYFLDGPSGIVERVIVDPNNRRVIAMILLVSITDTRLPVNLPTDDKTRFPVRLVHVSMDAVRYLTTGSGFLFIKSTDRSRLQDFDSESFSMPDSDWTPPYPYCPQDVLFPVVYPKTEFQTADTTHPLPFEELLQDTSFKEQLLVTHDPGS